MMIIEDPLNVIKNIKKKITLNMTYAFFSAVIFGMITHMYYITNNFPNADTNLCAGMYLNGYDWMLSIGRWLAYFFDAISSFFILPWIDGVISILLLGLISALIVDMFEIKGLLYITIVSASIVTFPSIMANFGYINYADTFMYSYLFAVLAIYIANKSNKWWKILISVILIACSVGIYQSFICVSIVLCILIIFQDLLSATSTIKQILTKFSRFLCAGSFGMLLYFILWKVIMLIRNVQPANYKGLTDYENYSLNSLIGSSIDSYKFTFQYLYTSDLFYNPKFKITSYILLSLIGIVFLAILLIKNKLYIRKSKLFLLGFIVLILPLGFGFIKVIVPASNVSPLTIEHISFFILTIIILLEKVEIKSQIVNVLKWGVVLGSVLIIYSNILISNVGYVNLQLQYEKAYSSMQRIMDRVLEDENYTKETPIFISGDILGDNYHTTVPQQKEYLKGLELVASDASVYNTMFAKESFIRTYIGIYIQYPSDEIQQSIINSSEYQNMPIYPSEGSVRLIHNVLVVKMSQ